MWGASALITLPLATRVAIASASANEGRWFSQSTGNSPLIADQVKFILLGGIQVNPETLLRWYVLHVLFLPFILVIFLAVHFWRIRKDGGISGPL